MGEAETNLGEAGAQDPVLLALATLEGRVQALVEQLSKSRAGLAEANEATERLRTELAERDRKIATLEEQTRGHENVRNAVRERVESLLGRIGDLEAGV